MSIEQPDRKPEASLDDALVRINDINRDYQDVLNSEQQRYLEWMGVEKATTFSPRTLTLLALLRAYTLDELRLVCEFPRLTNKSWRKLRAYIKAVDDPSQWKRHRIDVIHAALDSDIAGPSMLHKKQQRVSPQDKQ